MTKSNPYKPSVSKSKPIQFASSSKYLLRGVSFGGLIGLALGSLVILMLFYFLPGVPGVFELLVLLVGVFLLLVLPDAGIGAMIGIALKSHRERASRKLRLPDRYRLTPQKPR